MADGFSPIGLAGTGIPGQPAADVPQAGAMDFLKSTPLGLALMQGGLSAMSGTPIGQSFSQGFGLYQQLMAKEEGSQQQEFENALAERQVAATEGRLDLEKQKAKDEAALRKQKAANLAKALELKKPKGVDEDIWKQALDTEKANVRMDEYGNPLPVNPSFVYRTYNSMVSDPARKAYMPLGAKEIENTLNAANKYPDYAEVLFSGAAELYGADKVNRLRARWDKLQQKQMEDEAKKAEEEAAAQVATDTAAMPPAPNVTQGTTASPMGTYPTMPYNTQSNVPSYGIWNQILGR